MVSDSALLCMTAIVFLLAAGAAVVGRVWSSYPPIDSLVDRDLWREEQISSPVVAEALMESVRSVESEVLEESSYLWDVLEAHWARLQPKFNWRGLWAYPGLTLTLCHQIVSGEVDFGSLVLITLIAIPIGFVALVLFNIRYLARLEIPRRPAKTIEWQQVVPDLVKSTQEYCLILRLFDRHDAIVLPDIPRHPLGIGFHPTMSIERVVAKGVREGVGLASYAMVDARNRLAPAGPTWLCARSENNEWKVPVEMLIKRAHSIVLVMPAGPLTPDIGKSLQWEVSLINAERRQGRVILVLPPPDQDTNAYFHAARKAAMVMVALESDVGDLTDLDPLKVKHYENALVFQSDLAILIRHVRKPGHGTKAWFCQLDRRERSGARSYVDAIAEAVQNVDRELSGLTFIERYI